MSDRSISEQLVVDQLDSRIDFLLAGEPADLPQSDVVVAELLSLAAELKVLPRPGFKAELQAELIRTVPTMNHSSDAAKGHGMSRRIAERTRNTGAPAPSDILPSIAVPEISFYPVQRRSFMTSIAAHAVVLGLLITSGIWAAPSFHEKPRVSSMIVTDVGSYVFPSAADRAGGGGGGGDSDPQEASKGNPPRFAREQFAPPAIIVRSEQPRLAVEPTVVGPLALSFPQTSQMGDPFSRISGPLSNGPGSNGGMGSGQQGGVGPGRGPGVGDGWGGGIGGGPYVAGGGVSAPRPIYDPEPDYSDEARKAKYQGSVVLQIVVGADGVPKDMRIARSLGMGLDEKALEAVGQWRFDPGTLNGHPVPVVVNVEVNFRLY